MQQDDSEILTARELAKKLKVSLAAVRTWTRQGLPCHRLGGRLVRFHVQSALAWLEHRQRERTNFDVRVGEEGMSDNHSK